MLALILVVIMRPMPMGSSRFGARSPRIHAASADFALALGDGLIDPETARSARAPDDRRARRRVLARIGATAFSAGALPPLPARWRLFAGITSRPRATSSRMKSGVHALATRDAAHLLGEDAVPRGFELRPILGHRPILQRRIEYDSHPSVKRN